MLSYEPIALPLINEKNHPKKEIHHRIAQISVPHKHTHSASRSGFGSLWVLQIFSPLFEEERYSPPSSTNKQSIMSHRVVILGGVGFIGRHLVMYLAQNKLASKIAVCDKVLPEVAGLTPAETEVFKSDLVIYKQVNLAREGTLLEGCNSGCPNWPRQMPNASPCRL